MYSRWSSVSRESRIRCKWYKIKTHLSETTCKGRRCLSFIKIIDKEKIRRAEFWQREDQVREWHWESRRERISGVDSPCLVLIGSEMNRKRSLVLRRGFLW